MSRTIRLLTKKRGRRSTASERQGNLALAAFSVAMLVVGCALLTFILRDLVIPEWRIHQTFVRTSAAVVQRDLDRLGDGQPPKYRLRVCLAFLDGPRAVRSWVAFPPEDQPGLVRAAADRAMAHFSLGSEHDCSYDPADPRRVLLNREPRWFPWLMLLLPVALVSVGGGGLVHMLLHWQTSAERFAALRQRAMQDQWLQLVLRGAEASQAPTVPDLAATTDSPGTRLAWRLPTQASPYWRLLNLLAAALFVAGAAVVFTLMALGRLGAGQSSLWLNLFALAWIVAALAGAMAFFRELKVSTEIGRTIVEVSDHPFFPGREYLLYLSQSGQMHLRRLGVWLVCDERAVYRQGTDLRVERARVFQQSILEQHHGVIRSNRPLNLFCTVRLPEEAMHSFRSDHNEVQWSILVEVQRADGGEFTRTFPIVVWPCAAEAIAV